MRARCVQAETRKMKHFCLVLGPSPCVLSAVTVGCVCLCVSVCQCVCVFAQGCCRCFGADVLWLEIEEDVGMQWSCQCSEC